MVLGYVTGVLGASIVIMAAMRGELLLLEGSLLLEGANAAVFLSRYAAADLGGPRFEDAPSAPSCSRPPPAIAGPVLLVPADRVARALGLPRLTGLYLLAVLAFAGAAVAVAT